MVSRCIPVVALLLAGCASYDPPIAADHSAVRYKIDLQKCQKQASAAAAKIANATPQSAMRAVFTSDEPQHQQVRECMISRGYHLAS